jgi:hypothetical protein
VNSICQFCTISLVWETTRNLAATPDSLFAPKLNRFHASNLTRNESTNRSRRDYIVKKSGRIQLAREIIARVKREMREPRLKEPVRSATRIKAAPYSNEPAIRLEKA